MCLNYKHNLSIAFHLYPFLTVLSDILQVISLCLLHALPFNAILFSICAICSNIPELGSQKDCKPWNGICFSDWQVSFYVIPISEKCCGNWNNVNQTQNSHLKHYISGGLGDWHSSFVAYDYTTSEHTDL
jgi:hypothetical protein